MSPENCRLCKELLQNAALKIKQHLEATATWTQAMQHDLPDSEISALERTSRIASEARKQAVAEYKKHTAEHLPKASAAGE